jgi:hypothetical protein
MDAQSLLIGVRRSTEQSEDNDRKHDDHDGRGDPQRATKGAIVGGPFRSSRKGFGEGWAGTAKGSEKQEHS